MKVNTLSELENSKARRKHDAATAPDDADVRLL
jgi:hypothetical protein